MGEMRYFQWIAGEKKGEIQVFDKIETDDDMVFVCFTDKSRMNEQFIAQLNEKNLTGKFMAEIDHPNNCWKFVEKQPINTTRYEKDANSGLEYEIPSVNDIMNADLTSETGSITPKKKIIELIPPYPTASRFPPYTTTSISSSSEQISDKPQIPPQPIIYPTSTVDKTDPVYIVLNTSKKFDVDIEMTLTVSAPSKDLFNIIKENYDDGQNKTIKYIINNIKDEEIKGALSNAFINFYTQNDK